MELELGMARAGEDDVVCSFCKDRLDGPCARCSRCATQVHAECVAELHRCPTVGCDGRFAAVTRAEEESIGGEAIGAPVGAAVAEPAPLALSFKGGRAREPGLEFGAWAPAPARGPAPGEARPRGRRWPRVLAGGLGLLLLGGWILSVVPAQGERTRLGGWFSGHGTLPAAVAWTFTRERFKALGHRSVRRLGFSADGRRLVTVDDRNAGIVWRVGEGDVERRLSAPREDLVQPRWVGFVGADVLLVSGKGVVLWRGDDPEPEVLLAAALLPEVERPAWASALAGWAPPAASDASDPPQSAPNGSLVRRSPGGPRVALCLPDARVVVVELTLSQPVQTRVVATLSSGLDVAPDHCVFDPSGQRLAYGSYDTPIYLAEVAPGARGRVVVPGKPFGAGLTFSPDGQQLAWSSTRGAVLVDIRGGRRQQLPQWGAGYGGTVQVAFSPDGRLLAEGSRLSIEVYDLASGERVESFGSHGRGTVYDMAFSPNGALIATCSNDQTARLWATEALR